MTDFPDYNNVYGHVIAPNGLTTVLENVRGTAGVRKAGIKVSGYDGSESLILSGDLIEFESEPIENDEHLLKGCIAGTIEEIIIFIGQLSHALSEAKLDHHFEVYNEEQILIKEFPDLS